MAEHTKCMVPHLVKKGERLTIEGVEYRVTKAEKVPDSIFYEATLESYVANAVQEAETVTAGLDQVVAEVQPETAKPEEEKAE